MAWSLIASETLTCASAGVSATSTIYELNPGESAVIELLRTDTATESWSVEILHSIDGANLSDVATPRRQFSVLFDRPIFSQDSIGVRYFAARISNPNSGPTDVVVATLRVIRDGVSL